MPCGKRLPIFIAGNADLVIPASSWLAGSGPSGILAVLKQRVITALLITLVFLAALFLAPAVIFKVFLAIVVMTAAWEWANLCGYSSLGQRTVYVFIMTVVAAVLGWLILHQWISMQQLLTVSAGWWAIALLWVQGYPASRILWQAPLIRAVMGGLVLLPTWFSLVTLRDLPDGALWILAAVLIVAAADIGAYFSGRRWGRRKLAPSVSPAKSWEGVAGGVVAAILTFGVFLTLSGASPLQWLLLIAIPTALISVLGDLLESMLKRHRGIKDSGNILPGHGGVMDRVDGLAAAVPIFTLALLLVKGG